MPPARQLPRTPRPTLKAVAERAGVAVSTASLVFSGRGPVADATAERVRAAASELGYAGPDPRAASLRHGRAGAVGVVVEDRLLHAFRDPYAVSVLDGLAEVLDSIPTGLLLVAQPTGAPERALAHIAGLPLDAVVFSLCGDETEPIIDHLAARGIPMAGTGMPDDKRVHRVEIDDRGAQAEATRHVRSLGHRRLAHVMMPLGTRSDPGARTRREATTAVHSVTRERAEGFLAEAGRGAELVEAATSDVEGGYAAALALLDRPADQRPTAVVAQSDLLAMGVVRAATELGLSVPGDLSVTGFDGVTLPWFSGTLTTIDQQGQAKGRALGEVVRGLLDGRRERPHRILPATLRVGTTTAPPPT